MTGVNLEFPRKKLIDIIKGTSEENSEAWIVVFFEHLGKNHGCVIYYTADNSRLCVLHIVLAQVKCRKFDQ